MPTGGDPSENGSGFAFLLIARGKPAERITMNREASTDEFYLEVTRPARLYSPRIFSFFRLYLLA